MGARVTYLLQIENIFNKNIEQDWGMTKEAETFPWSLSLPIVNNAHCE